VRLEELEKWGDCFRCPLSETRKNVVIGKGVMPAKLLIIGEAPGKVEDIRGLPFEGRSGNLLDLLMRDASFEVRMPIPSSYITNILGCRPPGNRNPTEEEAFACWPRVQLILQLVKPREVIFLGKVAARFGKKGIKGAHHIVHPAYLLRTGGQGSPEYLATMRRFTEIFELCSPTERRYAIDIKREIKRTPPRK
jgi:uracil-DNA glycosylase family 4